MRILSQKHGMFLFVTFFFLSGCKKKELSFPVDSSQIDGNKLTVLAHYLRDTTGITDAAFRLEGHDNSGGLVPGPSDYHYILALRVRPEFLDHQTKGLVPSPQHESIRDWNVLKLDTTQWNLHGTPDVYTSSNGSVIKLVYPQTGIVLARYSSTETFVSAPADTLEPMATFYADSLDAKNYAGGDWKDISQHMVWVINGQRLVWGSSVRIRPDSTKLDTVLFKAGKRHHWDTILCNIRKPDTYRFIYNACCGGFNVHNGSTSPEATVQFLWEGKPRKNLIATVAGSGIAVPPGRKVRMKVHCVSAMAPNTVPITLEEVVRCPEKDDSCDQLMCYFKKENEEPQYDYAYRSKTLFTKFLYMPLDDASPLTVTCTKDHVISIR